MYVVKHSIRQLRTETQTDRHTCIKLVAIECRLTVDNTGVMWKGEESTVINVRPIHLTVSGGTLKHTFFKRLLIFPAWRRIPAPPIHLCD